MADSSGPVVPPPAPTDVSDRMIADAIAVLEAATLLELEEIRRIHELARDLEEQMLRNTALLAALRGALADARGPGDAREVAIPSLQDVDDRALRAALDDAPAGLAPRELREQLGIHHTVSGTQLSRALTRAVDRGAVARSGKGPGTRYHLAPPTRRSG